MKTHDGIGARLQAFIERQHLYFVATAPLSATGHVNLSPKGLDDTFVVLDEHTVAYLDLTGSGSETVAHLRENGRITVMFCAFDGAPNIVRLHGTGRYLTPHDAEFASHRSRFGDHPGVRGVVVVDVERVSDSCGYAVPNFVFENDRGCSTPGPRPGVRRSSRPTTANATPFRSTGSPPFARTERKSPSRHRNAGRRFDVGRRRNRSGQAEGMVEVSMTKR